MNDQNTDTTWVRVCGVEDVDPEELVRFDYEGLALIVIRSPEGDYYATDGHCTHEAIHLEEGLVIDHTVECPKHSGMFDYRTGEALAPPVCVNLHTYATKVEAGDVFVDVSGPRRTV